MPTLTDDIKEFIVKALARFDTPSQVVEAVNVNFGVAVSRQQVYRYDPGNSEPPSLRWRELHAATRQAFLRHVAEIGIGQKAIRLAMLERMAHHALADNYTVKAAAFLEQAAKECGGIYENRRAVVLQLPVQEFPVQKFPVQEFPMQQLPMQEPCAPQPSLAPNGSDATVAPIRLRQRADLAALPPAS